MTRVNFRCSRSDHFAVQAWADGVVVYDDASGSLHALSPIAGEAFDLIRSGQADGPEGLAQVMGLAEPTAEDLEVLQSLLVQFESMGLVECTHG